MSIFTVLLFVGGIFLFTKNEGSEQPASTEIHEYFWSITCSHCKTVSEFMEGREGKERIQIEKFEVSGSVQNKNLFLQRGQFCKIPQNQLGVPLLITPEGKCLNGDRPIIDYFEDMEF